MKVLKYLFVGLSCAAGWRATSGLEWGGKRIEGREWRDEENGKRVEKENGRGDLLAGSYWL